MEELLLDMKSDVLRLPGELSKMPSVSVQLKMDEISTISKLAKGGVTPTPVSQSVITRAPPTSSGKAPAEAYQSKITKAALQEPVTERKVPPPVAQMAPMVSQKPQATASNKYQVAYASGVPMTAVRGSVAGSQVHVNPVSGLTMQQTKEGNLVVYSVSSSSNSTQSVSIVQPGSVTGGVANATPTSNNGGQQQTYTIGVPTYLDSSNVFQAVQLVPTAVAPAATSEQQQVVYWPTPVVGSTKNTAIPEAAPVSVTSGGASQCGVIQCGQVLQQVQVGALEGRAVEGSPPIAVGQTGGTCSSVITID